MNAILTEFTGDAPAIAIIGMCKNAGKTTVLNRFINEYHWLGRRIAATSVGRDGERVDLVTGTEKPSIYLHEGMLAATASGLLPFSDVSREILDVTDHMTPLGRVVIFKARSSGFVQLAGPSSVNDMALLCKQLYAHGAETVLIDGALDRRSPAASALDGSCVLSTGASLGKDMDAVVDATAFICRLMTLPVHDHEITSAGRFTAFGNGGIIAADTVEDLCAALRNMAAVGVVVSGAFTDTMAHFIWQSNVELDGMRLIVEDSSRILFEQGTYGRLLARGANFLVKHETRLVAVAINPVSSGGWRFDADLFLEKMRHATALPVVDVERQ